tara:strand:- start:18 stop:923 length:906 start_codon:yes stop_codon:yes gene_type:complete
MINALVLSKDRASQLRLLLESIQRNAKGFFNKIEVLYTGSTPLHDAGYKKLQEENIVDNIVWKKEKSFIDDFLDCLENCDSEYLCGLVDDCVFYKKLPSDSHQIERVLSSDDDVFCFSLRLGMNTYIQNYLPIEGEDGEPFIQQHRLEDYDSNLYCIKWNWKEWDSKLNYGYPISLDGHIFRSEEIARLSKKYKFDYLRQWEGVLAGNSREDTHRTHMVAYRQSVLFSIPTNCVQDPPLLSGVIHPISQEKLNNKYLNNEVINIDAIECSFQNVTWCHNEIPLFFKQVNNNGHFLNDYRTE